MNTVYVAGSVNMDLVATSLRLPRPGETVPATGFARHPGGKGANQAVAAAKLGASVVLAGRVGQDPFGVELREFLRNQGVDVEHVRATDQAATGVALITVDTEGENTIVVAAGSNALLGPNDVRALPLVAGDIALAQLEVPLGTVESFFDHARGRGATTLLNAAPALALPAALLDLVDVLIVNEVELATYSNGTASEGEPARVLDAAERLRRSPQQTIVVTLGRHGAVAISSSERSRVAGHVVDVVDTTGAGDAFVGAYAAALADGSRLEGALEKANAAGAYAVGRAGAAESSPDSAQLTAWQKTLARALR
jgi:ribokinase